MGLSENSSRLKPPGFKFYMHQPPNFKMKTCLKCSRETIRLKREYCPSCYECLRIKGILKKIDKPELPKDLTKLQKEILQGLMLGDGCLYKNKKSSYPHLIIDRSLKDKDYLLENYSFFKKFCSTPPREYTRIKKSKEYKGISFATRRAHAFDNIYNTWYPENIKVVPNNLELTPISAAIWFCDDGHIRHRIHNKATLQLQLATNGFSLKENEIN